MSHEGNSSWVILIHGLFGNLDNLKGLANHLKNDFNVLLVDLPAHGDSPAMKNFDFVEYAEMVTNTIKHLEISQPHIVGHSLGGKIAMTMALKQLCDIKSLIVADIAPVSYPPRHDKVFNALNAVAFDKISSRSDVREIFSRELSDEGTRQFLLKGLKQTDNQWRWQFNLALLQNEYPKIIDWPFSDEKSTLPTLFIKGAESDYITGEMQPKIQGTFPNAKAHIIQSAGHWLHAQKPDVFNRIVTRFLQSHT